MLLSKREHRVNTTLKQQSVCPQTLSPTHPPTHSPIHHENRAGERPEAFVLAGKDVKQLNRYGLWREQINSCLAAKLRRNLFGNDNRTHSTAIPTVGVSTHPPAAQIFTFTPSANAMCNVDKGLGGGVRLKRFN